MILRCGLFLLVSLILLTGCAGSKIEGRKRERAAAYAALPPAQQRLVDEGRIEVGMPADVVYIAWGKPSLMVPTTPGNVTWIYRCKETVARPATESHPAAIPSHGAAYWENRRRRGMEYTHSEYDCAEVNFEGNLVKNWRELPKPEY